MHFRDENVRLSAHVRLLRKETQIAFGNVAWNEMCSDACLGGPYPGAVVYHDT